MPCTTRVCRVDVMHCCVRRSSGVARPAMRCGGETNTLPVWLGIGGRQYVQATRIHAPFLLLGRPRRQHQRPTCCLLGSSDGTSARPLRWGRDLVMGRNPGLVRSTVALGGRWTAVGGRDSPHLNNGSEATAQLPSLMLSK